MSHSTSPTIRSRFVHVKILISFLLKTLILIVSTTSYCNPTTFLCFVSWSRYTFYYRLQDIIIILVSLTQPETFIIFNFTFHLNGQLHSGQLDLLPQRICCRRPIDNLLTLITTPFVPLTTCKVNRRHFSWHSGIRNPEACWRRHSPHKQDKPTFGRDLLTQSQR